MVSLPDGTPVGEEVRSRGTEDNQPAGGKRREQGSSQQGTGKASKTAAGSALSQREKGDKKGK